MTPLVNVSETSDLLTVLGYTLTGRQIRYLGLTPAQRWSGANGGRLFDATDVTLLAVFADLLAQCRKWELPIWSARAALLYREAELRRAILRRSPRFLLVDSTRGTTQLSETQDGTAYAIDLRALAGRVAAVAVAHRDEHPDVWTGSEEVDCEDLVTA